MLSREDWYKLKCLTRNELGSLFTAFVAMSGYIGKYVA